MRSVIAAASQTGIARGSFKDLHILKTLTPLVCLMPSLDVITVRSAVIDHIYTLSNLPEPDGGAFVRSYTTAAGGVAAVGFG